MGSKFHAQPQSDEAPLPLVHITCESPLVQHTSAGWSQPASPAVVP